MTLNLNFLKILFLIIGFNLMACGGGGGSSSPTQLEGQFVDSIVSGLRYVTPTTSGFTDAQGRFSYLNGEQISFFVGDIFIGTATGQAIITPIELVPGALDESNVQVQNIAIFLQTIDEDGIDSNGISITNLTNAAGVGETVDFTLESGVFEANGAIQTVASLLTTVNGTARSLLPRSEVITTLRANLLTLLSGQYQGTFTGDDAGTWSITVDTDGVVTGESISNTYGTDTVSGNISSDGESSIDGTAGSSVFSGSFNRDGTVNGTWNDDEGDTGTFTGKRVTAITIPGEVPPVTEPGTTGDLTISGNDTGAIGNAFSPNLQPVIFTQTGVSSVSWVEDFSTDGITGRRFLILIFNDEGKALTLNYSTTLLQSAMVTAYYYTLDCEEMPLSCENISLNVVTKQATFTSTSLVVDTNADSDETGPLSLLGTLSW